MNYIENTSDLQPDFTTTAYGRFTVFNPQTEAAKAIAPTRLALVARNGELGDFIRFLQAKGFSIGGIR